MDTTLIADSAQIVKVFEKALLSSPSEEAIIGGMLPLAVSIEVNSNVTSSNIHDSTQPSLPGPIASILEATQGSVTLPDNWLPNSSAFQLSTDPLNPAKWQQWLEDCIPCQFRVQLKAELLGGLDDALIETLLALLNNFLKELAFILNILNAPDVYQDACLLLRAIDDICIPDLQRILSLLSSLLYRLTAHEIQSIDVMKLIVLPIFQPIFLGIAMLFSQYRLLVVDPLRCVSTNLSLQLEKLKSGDFLRDANIARIEQLTQEFRLQQNIQDPEKLKQSLKKSQRLHRDLDQGITGIQSSLGSSVFELNYWITRGINEVESLANQLIAEVGSFVGVSSRDNIDFLLSQYEKLKIFRLIAFVSGVIKALIGGFNCDLSGPDAAQSTLAQFFDNFLGPNSPVIVQINPDTNDIQLVFDKTKLPDLPDLTGAIDVDTARNPPLIIEATRNQEIDTAVNAIIDQINNPVKIKPPCFFEASTETNNKLAEWLKELDSIEV